MSSGSTLSDVQVLVVDDDVGNADSTALLFNMHGVRAERVYDAGAALERIQSACPELVLLDLAAPKVKGLDLARALQHAPLPQQTFLVAMSRYAADKRECAEAGFDLHLSKPLDVSTVLRVLALLHEARGLRKQAEDIWAQTAALPLDFLGLFTEMVAHFFDFAAATRNSNARRRFLAKAQRAHDLLNRHLQRARAASQSLSRFVLGDALDRALVLADTDLGHIQMLNRQGLLEISVQRGFGAEFLGYFHTVSRDDTSPFARSLSNKAVVAIEDVNADPPFARHRHIAERSNFRAVCSAPLIAPNGNLLGTISTHFVQPRRFTVSELQRYRQHARQSASLIRWAQIG